MKQKTRTPPKTIKPPSAEVGALSATQFLASFTPRIKPALYASVFLHLLDGLLLIVQSWMIASVLHQLAMNNGQIAEYRNYVYVLPVVFLVRAGVVWVAKQHLHCASQQLKQSIRQQCLQKIASLGPRYVGGQGTGKITHILGDAVEALGAYFSAYLPARFITVLVPLAVVVAVAPFDRISVMVMLITAPLIPFFMILIGKNTQEKNQRQWQRMARMSGYFLDRLQGLVTLKLLGAATREARAIKTVSDAYRTDTMAVLRVAFLSSLVLEFLATLSIAMIAVFIGFRLLWGEMELVHGLFILLLAPEFYLPLRQMGTHYHTKMDATAAAEQIAALWAEPEPVYPNEQATHQDVDNPPAIRFENVSLSYPDEEEGSRIALRQMQLEVAAGETLALVGPSGSGKSSLLSLLLGFVVPSEGAVLVDGVPLSKATIEYWRARIAWVPQQPHLFRGTIHENIALAKPEASLVEIRQAAQAACIDEDIMTMPNAYDTMIGERGVGLSGGQIRRVALARAFLRKASLVLLDEPTASLDSASEQLILRSLAHLCQERTVIMVAHRLETLSLATRVVRIEAGKNAGELNAAALTPQQWEALCD